jgi:hypothetical protein
MDIFLQNKFKVIFLYLNNLIILDGYFICWILKRIVVFKYIRFASIHRWFSNRDYRRILYILFIANYGGWFFLFFFMVYIILKSAVYCIHLKVIVFILIHIRVIHIWVIILEIIAFIIEDSHGWGFHWVIFINISHIVMILLIEMINIIYHLFLIENIWTSTHIW